MQDFVLRRRIVKRGHHVEHEIDTRRKNDAIIGKRRAIGHSHHFLVNIHGGRFAPNHSDAVFFLQRVIADSDVLHGL